MTKQVITQGLITEIEYRETKIGDKIYIEDSGTVYTATTQDADDLNWIIINQEQ